MASLRRLGVLAGHLLLGIAAFGAIAWLITTFGTTTAVTAGVIATAIVLASGSKFDISIRRHRIRTERPL